MICDIEKLLPHVQKPAQYTGGEYNSIVKDPKTTEIRFAFCFPDLYEVGMSHLGIKILYHLLNERPDTWCERVFAPNTDMEEQMRTHNVPLFALESREAVRDFDFIGFTLQYELSYTTLLNMIDLAGLPLLAKDRTNEMPILIGGGPCANNPEPLADFFDLFDLGEGEELLPALMDLYLQVGKDKQKFLEEANKWDSVYVPSLHDGKRTVTRTIVKDLDKAYYPDRFVVPSTEIVHDRISLEVMRGCIRGCRFCQAGIIYRPFRQKSPARLLEDAKKLVQNTGYDEISLLSLSTSDFEKFPELADSLLDYCTPRNINLALPSLRIDTFSKDLLERLQAVRKSGLTFAPEAGTQRLRDVINKNITEDDIFNACRIAFEGGAEAVKLYFMIGLPTETDEDILGIGDLAQRIVDLYYNTPHKKGRGVTVTITLSTFVPKPFTPFQWEPQISLDEIHRRQKLLRDSIRSKKVKLNWHESYTSVVEGLLSRGDRKVGQVLKRAWELGCNLDPWDEHFSFDRWQQAMEDCGLSFEDYAHRRYTFDETLPWDFVNVGVSRKFLEREAKLAYEAKTSPNCKQKCLGCGVTKICGGDYCGQTDIL